MEGGVQVISREILKPSSQTPLHPRKLKISYVDKLYKNLYIPLIFFYESSSNHVQISQRLRQSLLDTLPSFYPLAGRVKNKVYVDCNDAGVEFLNARIRANLKDVICTIDQLKQYIPSECTAFHSRKRQRHRALLVVQITLFDCGGVVIAICISHTIADLASAIAFLSAWAGACRGVTEIAARVNLGTTSYFPSLRLVPFRSEKMMLVSNENFATKRFVFDKEKLDILKQAATSTTESAIKDPSRVELISAFIWKHFVAARLKKGKPKKIYATLLAVNLRPKTTPPRLLENVFGNCVMPAMAFFSRSVSAEDLHLHEVISRLRRSIRRVKDGYITKPMNKESFMKDLLKLGFLLMTGKLEWCSFTSWRGFPTYELDFGWGKPIWFTTPGMPSKNLIILVSSKSGDEVEAIVTMMPDDLQILEAQIEMISTNI